MQRSLAALVAFGLTLGVPGCSGPEPISLPEAEEVEAWFGDAASVRVEDRRIHIDAVMDPAHLARGGRLWQRATPYFYLFNVHIRQVLLDYPSVDGVDVAVRDERDELLASVSINRNTLTIYEWDRAISYTSRAQREGTAEPRYVLDMIRWAEDRVESVYVRE